MTIVGINRGSVGNRRPAIRPWGDSLGRNTPVGTPNLLTYEYRGPAGQGLNFAPGFDLSNYVVIGGSFPLETVVFDEGLRSPTTDEFSASLGRQFRERR